jgi:hypothetical protein
MATVNLPCVGTGTYNIKKIKDKVTFGTQGKCNFISFEFDPPAPAAFTGRDPKTGGGPTISYQYKGSAIPKGGYAFTYRTDSPVKGNGTGVIKN